MGVIFSPGIAAEICLLPFRCETVFFQWPLIKQNSGNPKGHTNDFLLIAFSPEYDTKRQRPQKYGEYHHMKGRKQRPVIRQFITAFSYIIQVVEPVELICPLLRAHSRINANYFFTNISISLMASSALPDSSALSITEVHAVKNVLMVYLSVYSG